jgi:hypothetical protein
MQRTPSRPMAAALLEEGISEIGSHAQFEPVSSRFELVVGHDRSGFWGGIDA